MSGVSLMAAARPVATPSATVREPIRRSVARLRDDEQAEKKIDLTKTDGGEHRIESQCR